MIITSPPYDNIYDYNGNYDFKFHTIAKELFRVLKEGSVMIWIVGSKTKDFDESDTPFDQAKFFRFIGFKRPDTMIYQKSGCGKPEPAIRKRYVQSFEYIFVLSKGKIQKWNPLIDKPNSCAGMIHNGRTIRQKDGSLKINKKEKLYYNEFGLRPNVWKYDNGYMKGTKDKEAYKHPATFSEQMAKDLIQTYSNLGEIILDPFCGSGTSGVAALDLFRSYIGIDIVEEYAKLTHDRMVKRNKFTNPISYQKDTDNVLVLTNSMSSPTLQTHNSPTNQSPSRAACSN